MANQADVRRIALALPGAREEEGRFAFSVDHKGKPKGFCWVWLERHDPRRARVPNPEVLAIRVRDESEKEVLLAGDPDKFFTEPHYNGYPAVLVRLRNVRVPELRDLIGEAWRSQAPRELLEPERPRHKRKATRPRPRGSSRSARS